MTEFKARRSPMGRHVQVTVFSREPGRTWVNLGALTMLPEESEAFQAHLVLTQTSEDGDD